MLAFIYLVLTRRPKFGSLLDSESGFKGVINVGGQSLVFRWTVRIRGHSSKGRRNKFTTCWKRNLQLLEMEIAVKILLFGEFEDL